MERSLYLVSVCPKCVRTPLRIALYLEGFLPPLSPAALFASAGLPTAAADLPFGLSPFAA